MQQPSFEELIEASKPIVELLKKYYNPHTTAIITDSDVKIVCDDMGAPIKKRMRWFI